MQGEFKLKYGGKDAFERGVKTWLDLMEEWKEAEEDYIRSYNIKTIDEDLEIKISVEIEKKSLPVD